MIMKNIIPVVMALVFCSPLMAQDYGMKKQKIGRPSRWAVGVMGSPDFQGHLIIPTDNEYGPDAAGLLRDVEKPGLGFTTGLNIVYDLKSRWFMRMGIYFSDKAVIQDGFVSGFTQASGFAQVNSGKSKAPYGFLELPLTFHYFLNTPFEKNKDGLCFTDFTQHNQGKILFYVFAGPALSVNISEHVYDTRRWTPINGVLGDDSEPTYADPFSVYYFGAYFGAGAMKYFGQHICVFAEATLRYFPFQWYGSNLQPGENPDPNVSLPVSSFPVKDQAWSAGLQLGVCYHFQ
jgi:hypothetical protein